MNLPTNTIAHINPKLTIHPTDPPMFTIGGTNYIFTEEQLRLLGIRSDIAAYKAQLLALVTQLYDDLLRSNEPDARPPDGDDFNTLYNQVHFWLEP